MRFKNVEQSGSKNGRATSSTGPMTPTPGPPAKPPVLEFVLDWAVFYPEIRIPPDQRAASAGKLAEQMGSAAGNFAP